MFRTEKLLEGRGKTVRGVRLEVPDFDLASSLWLLTSYLKPQAEPYEQ